MLRPVATVTRQILSLPRYRLAISLVLLFGLASLLLQVDRSALPNPFHKPYLKSSYDWARQSPKYPVYATELVRLPTASPLNIAGIQHDFPDTASTQVVDPETMKSRRGKVKDTFRRTWNAYVKYAWGFDELEPLSLKGRNPFNGWGATLVDSLDTLWMMGMYTEFRTAVDFAAVIDWNNSTLPRANLFETNIRYLGGLLSAHDLSNDRRLLDKAVELGDMLLSTFDNPLRLPPFTFDFEEIKRGDVPIEESQSAAAIGSLGLEFTRLAQLSGDSKYYDAIDRIKRAFARVQDSTLLPGLWPNQINVKGNFKVTSNQFRLGGDGDSLYEYLVKMHLLLGGLDPAYEKMYKNAIQTAKSKLLYRPMIPNKEDILFFGSVDVDKDNHTIHHRGELEHLTCFSGGMMAMAGRIYNLPEDVEIGEKIARGCAWAYRQFPQGIMPEHSKFAKCDSLEPCDWDERKWLSQKYQQMDIELPKGYIEAEDIRYILRPEAIESLFILYRVTGKPDILELAWQMFEAIDKATATAEANAVVQDVTRKEPTHADGMESFFLSETLKYFYLIFSDHDFYSLDEWVFNTEAHPFKRPLPKR
jgi:mannosyl-oligosaccharide alpha-1,2-mannosidase